MRRVLGGLLALQVLVLLSAAVLARVVVEGIGPDDVLPTDREARARSAGAVVGVLVVLASVALTQAVQWLRDRAGLRPWSLVAAHGAGAVVLGLVGLPSAAAALLVAAAAWWALDAAARARQPAPTVPMAAG